MQSISQEAEPQMWRIARVSKFLGVAVPTIYVWIKNGTFPKPQALGPKAKAWLNTDVIAWAKAQPEANSGD